MGCVWPFLTALCSRMGVPSLSHPLPPPIVTPSLTPHGPPNPNLHPNNTRRHKKKNKTALVYNTQAGATIYLRDSRPKTIFPGSAAGQCGVFGVSVVFCFFFLKFELLFGGMGWIYIHACIYVYCMRMRGGWVRDWVGQRCIPKAHMF